MRPLIETESEEGGASGSSGSTGTANGTAVAGPSITVSTAAGDEIVLDAETIQMYLLLAQTLLLLYVTYKEASG
jgi:hypothetical protein